MNVMVSSEFCHTICPIHKHCILYCVVPLCVLSLKICVLCSALISFKTKNNVSCVMDPVICCHCPNEVWGSRDKRQINVML